MSRLLTTFRGASGKSVVNIIMKASVFKHRKNSVHVVSFFSLYYYLKIEDEDN